MGKEIIKVLITIFLAIAVISIAASPAWAAPDADVTDIYTPTSLVALQTFVVTVELFNYGTDGTVPLSMYIDGAYQTTFYIPVYEWSYSLVDVTVTGGLTAGYHTLMFCASNCRTEGWTWTGTPDLQLTDIYTPTTLTAGQDTTITARIDNIGNADAGPFYVYMYIDGQYAASWYYSSGLPAQYYSEPYVTITGGLVNGAHDIEFIADATSAVAESNEGNNNRIESFTWTGGVPDLELTDIYTPTSLTAGQDTTLTARIDNIGYADAGPFYVDLYIDGQYVAYIDFSSGLPARSYGEASVTISGGLINGTHAIKFIADSLNEVAESNEANNERTESFTWSGGVPDLELTDIYDPTSLTSGTDTSITAKVTNIGYADANPFYLDMYIDGQYVISVDFSSGLPARTYGEASVTITGGLVDGTHDIEFIADSLNEVSESNESNNNRTESWTWTGGVPDLELTDIYDPTSLVSGEDTTITAKVTNIGYADATPFYLDIYVDGEFVGYFDYTTGLPARTYSEASVTFLGGLPSGAHDITFIADALDEVAESDETNNDRTETWTWTGPTCTSSTGSGIGVLGDNKNHIDTCYVSSSDTYDLYDIARRANNNPHGHNGQMADDAAIETHYYNTGLMNDPDDVWNAGNQASGVDAHVYAAKVYDYLLSSSKSWWLNSYDSAGSSMKSIVEDTTIPNNAGWNTYYKQISFGIGSGQLPLSGALDIVAHEWAHGVTQMVGANLISSQAQPKAIKEAFSDWMGAAVENYYGETQSDVWTSGEGIIIIRSLSNPPLYPSPCNGTNLPQPDHMNGYTNCSSVLEEGYLNMGIPNKMFYLLSKGDEHYGVTVQGITIEKAIKIAFTANNPSYWPTNATFSNALDGMVWAAEYFYGTNSNEVYQVRNAWAAVGVGTLPVIVVNASTGGTVSGGGSKEWGATMTVTATPDTGYIFENWTESGNVVSTSSSYSFTVDSDRTLVANFTSVPVISVSPTSYDFGSYYVGNPSPYKTITVTNTGMSELTIQSVSIAGTDTLDFSYIDMCTGDILSPSENCLISVQFLPLSEGTKNAVLSIQSDDPVTPVLNVPLSGTGVNNPPTADPNGPYTAIEGQAITLDGSGSTDSDGTIDLYEWDIDNDGTYEYSSSSPTQNHTYAQDGTYTIKLRVTDNNGAADEATTTATISDTLPIADFTGSPTSGPAPHTVNFTNNSTGYDQPLSYEWDFDNDGTIDSTAQSPSYEYTNQGTYSVKLTVTDSDGSPDTLTRTDYITVTPPLYSLTITKTGSGNGTVTSSPSGIDCGVDCTETYEEGTIVTLTAIPDAGSTFTGWTGGGCSGTGDCTATMNADTTVTATFETCSNLPVRITGATPVYYSTLQAAYDAAVDGDIIQSHDARFTENLNINRIISVTLEGGYDCNYSTNAGETRLKGDMAINDGTVIIDNGKLIIE